MRPFKSERMHGSGGGVVEGFLDLLPKENWNNPFTSWFAKKKKKKGRNPYPYHVKNYPLDLPTTVEENTHIIFPILMFSLHL